MGILTRRQGDAYVITSDRATHEATNKRAPRWLAEIYQVWTGAAWSTTMTDALSFDSLEEADEYVRANFAKVTA